MLLHNLDLNADEKQTHLKVGVLVRSTLTKMLEENMISESEIAKMQTEAYSKKVFDIQYPLLLNAKGINQKPLRYWANPVKTYGEYYYICSEWYESSNNDDRSYFLAWLKQFRQ